MADKDGRRYCITSVHAAKHEFLRSHDHPKKGLQIAFRAMASLFGFEGTVQEQNLISNYLADPHPMAEFDKEKNKS